MLDLRWYILQDDDTKYCVLCLPGRGGSGKEICEHYCYTTELEKTTFVGVTPEYFAWYPMPFSAIDQAQAVSGIPEAIETIEDCVKEIQEKYNLEKKNIALAGFSAGGVMAIQVASHSKEPYACVMCHSGAILEPSKMPVAKHKTPILLFHSKDDSCFAWDERYLPMRESLLENDYNVHVIERETGEHRIFLQDLVVSGIFLSKIFIQDKNWKHSREDHIVRQLLKF